MLNARVRWIIKGRLGVISQIPMHHYFLQPMYTLRFYTSFQVSRIFTQIQNLVFPPGLQDTGHCIFMKPFFLPQLSIKSFSIATRKELTFLFILRKLFLIRQQCALYTVFQAGKQRFSLFLILNERASKRKLYINAINGKSLSPAINRRQREIRTF